MNPDGLLLTTSAQPFYSFSRTSLLIRPDLAFPTPPTDMTVYPLWEASAQQADKERPKKQIAF